MYADQGPILSSYHLMTLRLYSYIQTGPTLLIQLNTNLESSRSVTTFENIVDTCI